MIDSTGTPQSILVLGAGSAIAQATVEQLAGRGATTIVLGARHPDRLTPWMASLRRDHPPLNARTVLFDALDTDTHPDFVESVWTDASRIDLALVAFGLLGPPDRRLCRDHALTVARTNYLGAISLLLPVAAKMVDQGQGRIVVLSSVAAGRARATNAVYASTKAGLDAFVDGLAGNLAGTGVEVTIVRPGFVTSPMTDGLDPAPFATTPQAVATDIIRGLERGAPIVWSPQRLRPVSAILNNLPRPIYQRLTAGR